MRNTQGIIGFLGGERPIATPTEEIEAIKTQITEAKRGKAEVNFEIGEVVKINDGPFQNYNGRWKKLMPKPATKVTIDIFGRSTPVESSIGRWKNNNPQQD